MTTFQPEEVRRFLEAVDRALRQPAEVIVIGGSAAALRYGVTRATEDIDTWLSLSQDLVVAADQARQTTGLDIPLSFSAVADAPYEFESRLEVGLPGLQRLRVLVPERHDLVLMKTMRAEEKDLLAIAEMHRVEALDLLLLLDRYQAEMDHVITDPRRLRWNMLSMANRLYPDVGPLVERALDSAAGRRALEQFLGMARLAPPRQPRGRER